MFPLGSVLLPSAVLPLHVFEDRYRQMVRDCVDAEDHEFGVVLIERGSEVGGDDVRRDVAVVAQMLQVAELDDGRFAVISVGTRRVRINAWLPDDPYPMADIDDWIDQDESVDPALLAAVTATVRRCSALANELGDPVVVADDEINADPLVASYQLAALAPIGAADQYALLCEPGPLSRLLRLANMMQDVEALLHFRLADSDGLTGDAKDALG